MKLLRRLYPSGFKAEFLGLLELYIPCLVTNTFKFLIPMISVIMCGHLTPHKFDAASLANSIIYMLGLTIDMGFSTAFDTLFSQIYGSGERKKMGVLLQRAVIVMTLLFLVLASLHLNIQPILIGLKQDSLVAELTTRYLAIYLPGLFFEFQFLTMSRYLQNQNIVFPMMVSAFIGNIFSTTSQYIAIYVYGYGLEASALFQGLANVVMFFVQFGYVMVSGVYKETWDGISPRDALSNWGIIYILGIPGIFMLGLELWSLEATTFIAGSLNIVQLGAQSVAFQICYVAYMMTTALGNAVTIRVGQYLGSREINRLKTFLRVVATLGIFTSTFNFTLIFTLRRHISALFSPHLEIQKEAAILLIFISGLQFLDVILVVTSGVIKASGKQLVGAIIMLISFYLIGNPVGLVLVYVARINIKGMWIGLEIALFIEATAFVMIVWLINWEEECDKAEANTKFFEKFTTSENQLNAIAQSKENNEKNKPWSFKKTILVRMVNISAVLLVFLCAVFIRVYLPKSLYMPCVVANNQTMAMYQEEPQLLCLGTHNNYTIPDVNIRG